MKKLIGNCVIDFYHSFSFGLWMLSLSIRTYGAFHWGSWRILLVRISVVLFYLLLPAAFTLLCIKVMRTCSEQREGDVTRMCWIHLALTVLGEVALEYATKGTAFYQAPLLICYTSSAMALWLYGIIRSGRLRRERDVIQTQTLHADVTVNGSSVSVPSVTKTCP